MFSHTFCIRASGLQSPAGDIDSRHLMRAAELADSSAGYTAPHPNSGCVIARGSKVVGEGFLYAQGTTSAEAQAVQSAGEHARGATAYLNLEPGNCHGDDRALLSLTQAGISRVVVGLRHPLQHFRGKAIKALRNAGTKVDVLGEELHGGKDVEEALKTCQLVNAPILYRGAFQVPFSTLKYAMTLDGKIASSTGHAAWVTSQMSRQFVFSARGRSNAVVVGGNTVRRDNPRLTTRQDGGHLPARIVMSRCLDLPEEANLWDVSSAPTIVMTQRGVRKDFQKRLENKGVEIVEFEFLTPKGVMDYCYDCGFLSVLWECGGTLAAPAIVSGVIHKVLAFVAPKIIGGLTAPCPVGELGMTEMTQALNLTDVSFEKIGPDMLVTGYLQPLPDMQPLVPAVMEELTNKEMYFLSDGSNIISFYKAWDAFGAFSNFSPHSILMPSSNGNSVLWKSVEHYYQAQKFEGVQDSLAQECIQHINDAESPEEAARLGRCLGRRRPDLVRVDWDTAKVEVMYTALRAKFASYAFLRSLLLSTSSSILVEDCPHDLFWGAGREGEGLSHLGRLLMRLREEFLAEKECGVIDVPQSTRLDSFAKISG